jgi:hypothetical protein
MLDYNQYICFCGFDLELEVALLTKALLAALLQVWLVGRSCRELHDLAVAGMWTTCGRLHRVVPMLNVQSPSLSSPCSQVHPHI